MRWLLVLLVGALLAATLPGPAAGQADGGGGGGDAGAPYLVGFRALPDEARRGTYAGEAVERVDEPLGFAVVRARDGQAFAERAARDPNVRYVRYDDPNAYHALSFTPNDPLAPSQYAWSRTRMDAAWNVTTGDPRVVVAVLDSGIERAHPDLAPGRLLAGRDFAYGDSDPNDVCGHGTHVAGTLGAATGNGVGVAGAAQVTILPVKVLNDYCRGSWSSIASGIRYAADQGARVVSMSLGCGVSCYDTAAADAIEYAWGKGALVVVAAGNEGPCEDCIGFPASYARSLAVGCTDANDAICSFSSRGPNMVVAPGANILSTTIGGGYGLNSGTSMAAPHVAGAAALALSANPALTNAQLRALIESTATDLGAAGQDGTFGRGRLDAGALLAASGTPPPAIATTRGVDLASDLASANVAPGGAYVHTIRVANTGTADDVVTLGMTGSARGWKATLSTTSVALPPGGSAVVKLTVKAPKAAATGAWLDVVVTGASQAAPTVSDSVALRTVVAR